MDKKLRETTNLGVEIMNSKRQLKRKLGHVVQIYFLFWEILNLNLTFANSVNANLNLSNNSTDKLEVDGSLILPHSLSPSVLHFERISSESKNIKKLPFMSAISDQISIMGLWEEKLEWLIISSQNVDN